ncbi:MAG: hypothetical protein HUU01_08495 [Saprospiraceae bacterium]|nr:hypothetical protein [Saprospiraceae bacterium]
MIKFKLKNIDNILPFESEENQVMHWFALTDGEYWIEIKGATLFEYTDDIIHYWGGEYKYADYQIIRFIEDFTSLFFNITESVPGDLFEKVKSAKLLKEIEEQRQIWMREEIVSDDKEMAIEESSRWIMDRTLDSWHLIGGPKISFFRHNEKVAIVWIADEVADNRIPIWTAQTGEVEMDFEDLILQIEDFGRRFLAEMEKQVENALKRDWGAIIIDMVKLKERQIEMAEDFNYWIKILRQDVLFQELRKSGALPETNWQSVRESLGKLNNNSSSKG